MKLKGKEEGSKLTSVGDSAENHEDADKGIGDRSETHDDGYRLCYRGKRFVYIDVFFDYFLCERK